MPRGLLLLLAIPLASCAVKPTPPLEGHVTSAGVVQPFAPVVMQVHPLTRIVRSQERSEAMVICHLELRDSWGDACKGAGKLSVMLYRGDRAGGGGTGGTGTQELRWEVDLTDLDRNSKLYDPATRTYRLLLEGLPSRLASPDSHDRLRLRALLQTWGTKGDERTLQDEYVLEP